MEAKDAAIIFRIDESIKKQFDRICEEMDITPSQILRRHVKDIVEDYNRKNAQQGLFPATGGDKTQAPIATPKKKEKPRKSTAKGLVGGMFKKAGI